jgi:ketosteroid isomerase-like protein/uncharacterized protein YciI
MRHWRYTFDYADPALRQEHRPEHLRYLEQLARNGHVVLGGPVLEQNGGMVVFRGTREEVEAAIAADPYTLNGVCRNAALHEWPIAVREQGAQAPEENETLVRTYYSTVDTAGPEDVVALFAPEAVYRRPGYDDFRGRPALLEFYASHRVIAHGAHAVASLLVSGDSVAVEGNFEGTLRSGAEARLRFADFFRVADGLIVERNTYFSAPLV